MLLLQLFKRQVSSGLVIGHVVIPCLRELEELSLLSGFDVLQLLLLGSTDGVTLTDGLFSKELIELAPGLFGFLVFLLNLAFLTILLEQSQEVKHLAVGCDVDDTVLGGGLSQEVLSVQVVRIVDGQFRLDFLHHRDKVLKVDSLVITKAFLHWMPFLLLNLHQQQLCLLWISVQRLHDGFEVLDGD